MNSSQRTLLLARRLSQGLEKQAGLGSDIGSKLLTPVFKAGEKLLKAPARFLLGSKGKVSKGVTSRLRPRKTSGWKRVELSAWLKAKKEGRKVGKVGGDLVVKKREFGGVVGAAVRRPVLAGTAGLIGASTLSSGNPGTPMSHLRQQAGPYTPQIPQEYQV